MNRKRQQADILFAAGALFGPLLKVCENPESYDTDEKTRIFARFYSEKGKFEQAMILFTQGEDGHNYASHWNKLNNTMHSVLAVTLRESDEKQIYESVRAAADQTIAILQSIPVPIDSTVHAARTPFSTYCFVKDLCSTAAHEIIWLDRYFDSGIFHRYFVDMQPSATVTLVTWPNSRCTSNQDKQRYAEFMDLSCIFARERGPTRYKLVANEKFHDRWLCCDDKLLTLGGSIKDIGKDATFTVSRLDCTPENRRQFDDAVTHGTELFGPQAVNHP